MEFLACGGEPLVVLFKAFQPLFEVCVHVVTVYESRVDLGYMTIELVRRLRGASGADSSHEQLFVALHEDEIGPLVDDRLHEVGFAASPSLIRFLLELVGILVPREALHFRGFEELVELDKLLGKLSPSLLRCGKFREIANARSLEHHEYLLETRVHQRDIVRKLLHEHVERAVARVQLHRSIDVALHSVGTAVVADGAERLVGAEQAVGAAEGLDDALVVDDLVEVERVEPLGVEACKHLVYHDEQVDATLAVGVDVDVGLLMGKARRDVLLHGGPGGNGELLAICFVVILDKFDQGILLYSGTDVIVDARVKKRRHLHLRRLLLEGAVVVNRLRDGARRQDRVELAAMGEHREAPQNVLDHLTVVRRVGPVLGAGQEVLDALDAVTSAVDQGAHGDLRLVHVVVEDLAFMLVGDGLDDV